MVKDQNGPNQAAGNRRGAGVTTGAGGQVGDQKFAMGSVGFKLQKCLRSLVLDILNWDLFWIWDASGYLSHSLYDLQGVLPVRRGENSAFAEMVARGFFKSKYFG